MIGEMYLTTSWLPDLSALYKCPNWLTYLLTYPTLRS